MYQMSRQLSNADSLPFRILYSVVLPKYWLIIHLTKLPTLHLRLYVYLQKRIIYIVKLKEKASILLGKHQLTSKH